MCGERSCLCTAADRQRHYAQIWWRSLSINEQKKLERERGAWAMSYMRLVPQRITEAWLEEVAGPHLETA